MEFPPALAIRPGAPRPFVAKTASGLVRATLSYRRTVLGTLIISGIVLVGVTYEVRTSAVESWLLSRWAERLSFALGRGPSPSIVFPCGGPEDERRGYTRIPLFRKALEDGGFHLAEQVRFSPELSLLARLGVAPPYREPTETGLVILGAGGTPLLGRRPLVFETFEDVPPLVAYTAAFIENRRLTEPGDPRLNPVVDWGRLAVAMFRFAGRKVGLPVSVEGGSTLATQMEKYRHSPGGRTPTATEKLKQMAGASLRVYRDGPYTHDARREILVDYLNTMPLSGAPGYGEVSGLGEGLRVWYGRDLADVRRDLAPDAPLDDRARAFKYVLALLCAVRAPSFYLHDEGALEERADQYTRLIEDAGILEPELAARVLTVRLGPTACSRRSSAGSGRRVDKATDLVRRRLLRLLDTDGLYDLDRLRLEADSTLDVPLQRTAEELLRDLKDPVFLDANGLRGDRLLSEGDPTRVVYSLLLVERTPAGDLVRVQTDTSGRPFDLNDEMKMELGSTAKVRTLAHYLELVAGLHREISSLDRPGREAYLARARDPITRWAARTLLAEPGLSVSRILDRALGRSYSASPDELFFTGGGTHVFANFDPKDNGRVLSVREAAVHSTNLVFIRLMRDLVKFHEARLPYDTERVLGDPGDPDRPRLLGEIADREFGHRQGEERRAAVEWLLHTRSRKVQDLRLRIRFEEDAFERMLPAWRRLGFPFDRLVPSLATAIGSSSDRPSALAELMGIIASGGERRPKLVFTRIRLARGTPYETIFDPSPAPSKRVMDEPVARALHAVLVDVVDRGTAQRFGHVLTGPDGELVPVAGKTGSGDNRWKVVDRFGRAISSRAVSRTAAFAFTIGDRYYGALTAAVYGREAAGYRFTSVLPVTILKLLAPALNERLAGSAHPEEKGRQGGTSCLAPDGRSRKSGGASRPSRAPAST